METSLPAITTTPRFKGVPKRYEETRPVIVQDFTHHRILGLGHLIHKRQMEEIEILKREAIQQAEQEVWSRAEEIQAAVIEKIKEQAKLEQERSARKLMKELDKKIKEEGLKVEMEMQKLAIEQVKEERLKGESTLKEAVNKAEKWGNDDKLAAIAHVRTEERKIAEITVNSLSRKHKAELEQAEITLKSKHQAEIATLTRQKALEQTNAVKSAREEEKSAAAAHLEVVKTGYNKKLADLQSQLDMKIKEVSKQQADVSRHEETNQKLEECLRETYKQFEYAVKMMGSFSNDQASFLVPPLIIE